MQASPFAIGLVTAALLVAGCSGGASPADDPTVGEGAGTQTATGAPADDGADAPDDGDETTSGDGAAAAGGGTATLDGTTYEVTEVLDCTLDDPMAPDDRQFIGRSADGSVEMSVSYFEDESLAGLNGLSLTFEGSEGEEEWTSSVVGSDVEFTIEQRPDGADGTAEVRRQGPDAETLVADWSFTC